MAFKIRSYNPEDFRYCDELTKRNMREYFERYKIAWESSRHKQYLNEGVVRVAEINKRRAGFLHISHGDDHSYIHNVQISSLHRGKGLGTKLMQKAYLLAIRKGFKKIRLAVYPDNPAVRLYEREGFQIIGKKSGKLIMEKSLD